jgi:hypothetical protein
MCRSAAIGKRNTDPFVDQLADLVPMHEILDAVGAEQPVDDSLRTEVTSKPPHRVEREARSGSFQFAIADGEQIPGSVGEAFSTKDC